MSISLNISEFDTVLGKLKEKYKIFAPVRRQGRGRFSDTDVIIYDEVSSFQEMELQEKSDFSPKDIIFRPTETIFHFTGSNYSIPEIDDKDYLIFLRPCDINGIKRLDTIYLKNGSTEDFYYKRLREKTSFAMIECTEGFENCFCVSMNSNKTDNYIMAVRFYPEGADIQVHDAGLSCYFDNLGSVSEFMPQFIEKNEKSVTPPDIEEMPREMFSHKMWDEYSSRCIACGRCNTACVTCSCFTTTDIYYDDNNNVGERRRSWAGCHIDGFTKMAGGHEFRKKHGEKMRFKAFHKIYDYKKRFGENMCVGCGRCDDICPEYISFSSCINKVTKILEEDYHNGK